MPARILAGAMCVQRFDDSLNSAIHITYRISLRSSSMPEPRDPLLKVLIHFRNAYERRREGSDYKKPARGYTKRVLVGPPAGALVRGCDAPGAEIPPRQQFGNVHIGFGSCKLGNDPSAGSPTETLLRLLLPLNDRVWRAFRP
jgi:hypothetical protein